MPPEAETFIVHRAQAGMRLDQFLKDKLKWRSRTKVQELIETREITANGVRVDRSYRVKPGEEIRIPLAPPPEEAFRIAEIPLGILYEEDLLGVMNKQPHIVVHPTGPHRYDTLINALHLRYRNLDDPKKDIIPKLAHRIDRETSGVLVVCKTGRHERGVPLVFERSDVRKEYLALAEGVVESDSGMIDLPLGREPGKDSNTLSRSARGATTPIGTLRAKQAEFVLRFVTPDGAPARTGYEVAERFNSFTLVRARLFTGRQHQIRVHLQALGHPVVCDKFYGIREEFHLSDARQLRPDEDDVLLLDRQALHSWRVTFPHPTTGKQITVEAPLPDDMRRTLELLRGK
ncbi:MAG: RluA family pseudouridine synthase [Planctomycetia bacterium]|nr:RluA family pseudouridine synthase [Planctomycetia bacterium]